MRLVLAVYLAVVAVVLPAVAVVKAPVNVVIELEIVVTLSLATSLAAVAWIFASSAVATAVTRRSQAAFGALSADEAEVDAEVAAVCNAKIGLLVYPMQVQVPLSVWVHPATMYVSSLAVLSLANLSGL